jgi:hypothetical protein
MSDARPPAPNQQEGSVAGSTWMELRGLVSIHVE